MMSIKIGTVEKIIKDKDHISELLVKINNEDCKAVLYKELTNNVAVGDRVLLNTTAVELSLGTGGNHFVICNLEDCERNLRPGGHIMKLRYTPYQLKVFAAEEQDSEYHDLFNQFKSLNKTPVIIGTLHSMLVPISFMAKHLDNQLKIVYIMTDGAALPINLSKAVDSLKNKKIIEKTITVGNSFGGDLECVNIYNGLIAAKEIEKADLIVVTMGPGITGTGTKYGFTGVEQGQIIDAVNTLGGIPVAIPRISFADKRKRHRGISHHSITVLKEICKTKAYIPIPKFNNGNDNVLINQLLENNIDKKHEIKYYNVEYIDEVLSACPFNMRSMGRNYMEDREYFITAALSSKMAIDLIQNQ
ncbi:MAG: DUF3866 family protein [Anaeromicrobium sp.]|jgi:hypothetical protein|uniref:DUF3866 family protein n=1 Tax=Anaeromicrobium sp. TaxID=1929132 RepID=UPI0025EA31E2|nr:DUF3866 family protein [Anaeromicrobium sp.]MCT4594682.1 DUF3866 family protein [Anaeromicrobium sp.]